MDFRPRLFNYRWGFFFVRIACFSKKTLFNKVFPETAYNLQPECNLLYFNYIQALTRL